MHLGDLRYNIGMQDGIDELRNAFGFMGFFATVFRIVAGDILNDESRAEREGRIGEEWVRDTLERLNQDQFAVMRNVILPFRGRTTEIDAVVFSRFGVFVIEAKTWGGWVFGQKGDKIWTVVYPGGRKRKFGNPLRQNHGHVKALAEMTGLPLDVFHSVVVFLGECEFKTSMPENVIRRRELEGYILSRRWVVLDEGAAMNAIAKTDRASDKSSGASRRHAESVRARH